ncbi:MAG: class I SAM-dependent methyltransferase [Anaerolineaceae bacterium]|nr:class I SAM-dependent methyltransferase [Anaerolineaceae bacterium]
MARVFVKQGREKSILHHHPWLYSGAIDHIEGSPDLGETVKVVSSKGSFLGWGAYSPASQIRIRFWSFDESTIIDDNFLSTKIKAALSLRSSLFENSGTNAFRLVHAESDDLPGLIVDKYADFLVLQILSAGAEYWKETFVSVLNEILHPAGIYERSDVAVRELENLPETIGLVTGKVPPDFLTIYENNLAFNVDLKTGQKTGFYLDQRVNRQYLSTLINSGSLLNCFAYTGAFSVYALSSGVESILSIDSSADSLESAKLNIIKNKLPIENCEWLVEDVFIALRGLRDRARSFDTIILDPPKFAPTAAHVQKAARAYKDINLLAFKLLKSGGTLLTFSCSGGIDPALFQKIVSDAALDANVNAKVVASLTQGPDHPISLNFPEGAYLKGLVCKIN